MKGNKSDQKKRYLATCTIDLAPSNSTRNKSIMINKPISKNFNHIKISSTEDENDDDSEGDDLDVSEENFGENTEKRDNSISELIRLHKLHTAKPISKKIQQKPDNESSSSSSSTSSSDDAENED